MARRAADDYPLVHCETRPAWREWLTTNHATSTGIWFVSWKKATGRPYVPYAAVVEESLCFGWIDSVPRKLDEEHHLLLVTPRKTGSGWSRLNKQRVDRLAADGLLHPAGISAIERAKADGSWTALDQVEAMVEPEDLVAAFAAAPASARTHWDAFPPSTRKGVLQWIASAKQPDTRDKRIRETVTLAAENTRANQPRQPKNR